MARARFDASFLIPSSITSLNTSTSDALKPGSSSKDDVTNKDIAQVFDPNKILGGLESIELLAESLAELYCLKHGSETLKWIVVSAIQFLKYVTSSLHCNVYFEWAI